MFRRQGEQMRTLRGIALGLFGATCVPALVFSAIGLASSGASGLAPDVIASGAFRFAIPAAIVAGAHALLLGLPAFLVLWKLGKANWLTSGSGGFVIGAAPLLLYSFPRDRPGWSSSGRMWGEVRDFYVNGTPTVWEWLGYAQSAAYFGFFGLCGGLAFWLLWKRFGPQPSSSV